MTRKRKKINSGSLIKIKGGFPILDGVAAFGCLGWNTITKRIRVLDDGTIGLYIQKRDKNASLILVEKDLININDENLEIVNINDYNI